jgi:hypothetical protein
MKPTVEDVFYYGYKQGVVVYIEGKKYPTKKGHVYSEYKDNNKAIKQALLEQGGY